MITSILTSVKKALNLDAGYTAFDEELIIHINSAFATLTQLGVGPEAGFEIVDDTATWASFFGANKRYNFVKNYVFLLVKGMFDPAPTSYVVSALQAQLKEFEWRISVLREETAWVDPDPEPLPSGMVLDGGDA